SLCNRPVYLSVLRFSEGAPIFLRQSNLVLCSADLLLCLFLGFFLFF
ncbi:MAG: hypothetical protein RLZZ455_1056, partial [Candidatus Parcubacteria bacterium]